MIFVSVFLLILATVGAVFLPWFVPFLIAGVMHLIKLGINPFWIIIVCTITATMTTTGIRFLSDKIHRYLNRYTKKNLKNYKKGFSRKLRNWFDKRFSIIRNQKILFLAIMIGSGSMIPDIFLVEFGRIKMKFHNFIIATMLGKLGTYCLMIFGFEGIVNFFKHIF